MFLEMGRNFDLLASILVIFEVVSGSEGIISSKNNSCVKLMQIKICDRNEVLRNRFQKNARNFLICENFFE